MDRRLIFAVDAGATKTAAALFTPEGACRARATAGPCNLYQNPEQGAEAMRVAWRACCDQAGIDPADAAPGTILSAGAAGIGAPGAALRLRAALPAFAAQHLSTDIYIALVGAFGAGEGVVLSIGTGVAGCAREPGGGVRCAGGWGFPIGDQGGGAWLGFALVQRWLDRLDGAPGPHSTLWDEIARTLGRDRASILAWLRTATPASFAAFAPAIAAASGDVTAGALLHEAAGHVLRLARVLRPSRDVALALCGALAHVMASRLAELGPLRLDACPLRGAWRIARGEAAPDPAVECPASL